MSVATAAKIGRLAESKDFKTDVLKELGDHGVQCFANQVLVAIYFRNKKTAGGIIRPDSNVEEDAYQSKVGMVLKKGVAAFRDDEARQFLGDNVEIGDYVMYRASDGFPVTVNGVPCRMLADGTIKAKLTDPEMVF